MSLLLFKEPHINPNPRRVMALFDPQDRRYRALWSEALSENEHATTAFWTYWFRRDKLFKGDDWNITPEQPPYDRSDRRRVDLLINKWINGKWHTLFFFEAKKGTAGTADIEEVEQQAFTACQAWLMQNSAHEMYAMTAFGISAKLWYTTLDVDYLLPMAPATGDLSDKATYISAASSDAYLLRDGFETIIKNPAGLSASQVAVLKSNSTPPKSSTSARYHAESSYVSPTPPGRMYTESTGIGSSVASTSSGYGSLSYASVPEVQYAPATSNIASTSSGYGSSSYASVPEAKYASYAPYAPAPEDSNLLPDDARYVEVTYREKENRYFYRFEYEGIAREAEWSEWERKNTMRDGQLVECYLNTRKNGLHFWTSTLDLSVVPKYVSKPSRGKHHVR
jgi:hypothetical protein